MAPSAVINTQPPLTLHQRDGKKNRWTSPQLDGKVWELQTEAKYRTALAPLRVRLSSVPDIRLHCVAHPHNTCPSPMCKDRVPHGRYGVSSVNCVATCVLAYLWGLLWTSSRAYAAGEYARSRGATAVEVHGAVTSAAAWRPAYRQHPRDAGVNSGVIHRHALSLCTLCLPAGSYPHTTRLAS